MEEGRAQARLGDGGDGPESQTAAAAWQGWGCGTVKGELWESMAENYMAFWWEVREENGERLLHGSGLFWAGCDCDWALWISVRTVGTARQQTQWDSIFTLSLLLLFLPSSSPFLLSSFSPLFNLSFLPSFQDSFLEREPHSGPDHVHNPWASEARSLDVVKEDI